MPYPVNIYLYNNNYSISDNVLTIPHIVSISNSPHQKSNRDDDDFRLLVVHMLIST